MDENTIKEMVKDYEVALMAEVAAKTALLAAQEMHQTAEARLILAATEDGRINGKNAETRAAQKINVLANDEAFQGNVEAMATLAATAAQARAAVEVIAAKIGLYKALLYSQAPRT